MKGNNEVTWVKLSAHHNNDCKVYVKVEPDKIIQLDRIFEGHDGLGIVSTIDGKTGDVVIHVTPDTRKEVLELLEHVPIRCEVMDGPPELP